MPCREGDIAALNAQAVTSATNEAMTDFRHPATRSVFDKAGPGLLQECRQQIQSKNMPAHAYIQLYRFLFASTLKCQCVLVAMRFLAKSCFLRLEFRAETITIILSCLPISLFANS